MFPFAKFHSITKRIDTLIIHELKTNVPRKYWAFWFSDLIAKIGAYGSFCVIGTYIVLAMVMQLSGIEMPEDLLKSFANWIIALIAIGLVSWLVRAKFYSELESMVFDIWQRYINDKH